MTELKPCPFCGGEAKFEEVSDVVVPGKVIVRAWKVKCQTCFASALPNNYYGDKLKAAGEWNTRVERTCGVWRGDPTPYAITDFEAHEDYELWCEHCDIELDEDWSYCPSCGAKVMSDD